MKNLLKRNKKNIFNGSFLIILFMITLYYVFHGSGDSLSEVWAKMQMADPVWVVLSVIFIVLFIYGESHIIHYLFGTFGIRTRTPAFNTWGMKLCPSTRIPFIATNTFPGAAFLES